MHVLYINPNEKNVDPAFIYWSLLHICVRTQSVDFFSIKCVIFGGKPLRRDVIRDGIK